MNKIKNTKKLKYGSLSVVFIAVVILLVIGINLVVTWLDNEYDLKADLTDSKIYSLSGEVDDALKTALGDKYSSFDITITFCCERDMLTYYDSKNTEITGYYTMIRDLAEELSNLYNGEDGKGKVTVQYKNVDKNPTWANKVKQIANISSLTWKNIIIQNTSADENDAKYYRVLSYSAFYVVSSETGLLYGSKAEARYAASIIQCVKGDKMTAALIVGHGEEYGQMFMDLLTMAPLEIVAVDLDTDDIPETTSIVVISGPQSDFTSTEIDKLTAFMADKETYNSMMVFVNDDTPELKNLQSYLWDEWGLDYVPGARVTDSVNSLKGNSDDDSNTSFTRIKGNYNLTDEGIGQALISTANSKGTYPILPQATALRMNDTAYSHGYLTSAVYAYDTAQITINGVSESAGNNTPLIAVSNTHDYKNDDYNSNSDKYEYVMLVGSTEFISDSYLLSSYGNYEILCAATRAMVTDRVSLDFDYKLFKSTPLNLTSGTARKLTVLVTVALPLAIIIAGIAVFFVRRHR